LEDKTRRRPFPVAYSVIPVAMPPRRFPPPWSVEETDACFIFRDASGQALAYGAHSFGVHLHPDNAAIG
jgi:hypothetical protein